MTAASRGQQINTKYKQISKVVHMFLPEIQTKSISLSASAQISILLRSESEWAQKRCTGSAPMALQLSDKLVCRSHVLPSMRECALNMIGRNTQLNVVVIKYIECFMHHMPRTAECTNLSTVPICLLYQSVYCHSTTTCLYKPLLSPKMRICFSSSLPNKCPN